MGASAWAQMANPAKTINNVRSQLGSAANALSERREQAANPKPEAPPSQATSRKQASSAKSAVSQMEVKRKNKPAAMKPDATTSNEDGTVHMRGKRDPFVSVIRTQSPAGPSCATGKKCLVIGDILLKGIVRSQTGMIAVVENGARKTYFLHENDPVFNGQVTKIEPDAIVFRETVVDKLGRQSMREVVKRILKPSIS